MACGDDALSRLRRLLRRRLWLSHRRPERVCQDGGPLGGSRLALSTGEARHCRSGVCPLNIACHPLRRAPCAAVVAVAPAEPGGATHLMPPVGLAIGRKRYRRQDCHNPHNRATRHSQASVPSSRAIERDSPIPSSGGGELRLSVRTGLPNIGPVPAERTGPTNLPRSRAADRSALPERVLSKPACTRPDPSFAAA